MIWHYQGSDFAPANPAAGGCPSLAAQDCYLLKTCIRFVMTDACPEK